MKMIDCGSGSCQILKAGRCLAHRLGPLGKMRIPLELGEGRRAEDSTRCAIFSLEPLGLWW